MPHSASSPTPASPARQAGSALLARGVGLALGVAADQVLGDPHRHHPVAWYGSAASRLEERLWADSRARGVAYAAACLAPLALAGAVVESASRRRLVLRTLTTAVTTWAVLGARSLADEGLLMADRLESDDLGLARDQLGHLCGRDPSGLDQPELARATVESLAENTADAAVASLLWGALAGVPGLLVHRGANTLDAMVGHRTARHAHFGTTAARLDDLLDLLPARMTGLLAVAAAPLVGADPGRAWRILRRDHARHPSPNGGWCESAWAGALGVQLGGRNVYPGGRVEHRPLLGDGPRPDAAAVRTAASLVTAVTVAATAAAAIGLAGVGHLLARDASLTARLRRIVGRRSRAGKEHR